MAASFSASTSLCCCSPSTLYRSASTSLCYSRVQVNRFSYFSANFLLTWFHIWIDFLADFTFWLSIGDLLLLFITSTAVIITSATICSSNFFLWYLDFFDRLSKQLSGLHLRLSTTSPPLCSGFILLFWFLQLYIQ